MSDHQKKMKHEEYRFYSHKDYRVAIGLFRHPKIIKLKKRLGLEGIMALLLIWDFAAVWRTKGILDGMSIEDICITAEWGQEPEKLINTLVELRLLDVIDSATYGIHDWEDHQGFIYYASERSEQAKLAGKASAEKRARKANLEQTVERVVDNQLNSKSTGRSTPSPGPIPFHSLPVSQPSPKPKPEKVKKKPPVAIDDDIPF